MCGAKSFMLSAWRHSRSTLFRLPAVPGIFRIFHWAAWAMLATLPAVAYAQGASQGQIRRADPPAAQTAASKYKATRRPAARPSKKAYRKSAAQSKPASPAPVVTPLLAGDLPKRTAAELEALIADQRNVVKTASRNEIARRNLGRISVEVANRILQAQSLGRLQEVSAYTALVKTSLADTLWRVTQLAREEPAGALAALGLYHAEGILVPVDPERGCDYFAKAARAGQLAAAYRASQCLSKAEPEQARRWLEESAIGGNPAAQETMGRSCIEGASVDAACAKKWLQPAATQGRVSAISVLAWLYAREGTAESLTQASKLYRGAAEVGDIAAQNNLGELYETGRGVSRDPAQALGWYRKSAEGGFGPAQFNLARLLAFGLGTERDTAAAREWALKAQGQGVAQATELLKLIAEAAR
jgi:TPR repeat protein